MFLESDKRLKELQDAQRKAWENYLENGNEIPERQAMDKAEQDWQNACKAFYAALDQMPEAKAYEKAEDDLQKFLTEETQP